MTRNTSLPLKEELRKESPPMKEEEAVKGGPGGNRTLVQTGKEDAFYMLISFWLSAIEKKRASHSTAYPLKISSRTRGRPQLFPICCTTRFDKLRNNSYRVMSRPDAWHQDKGNLLYFNYAARA